MKPFSLADRFRYKFDNMMSRGPIAFLESARRRGEVAVGYRLYAERNNTGKAYGVMVNPVKSELVSFAENDRIIVLAEN